jgi:alpha-tubulin suppressor-like RCC1 family protein
MSRGLRDSNLAVPAVALWLAALAPIFGALLVGGIAHGAGYYNLAAFWKKPSSSSGPPSGVARIAGNGQSTCYIKHSGYVKCFGTHDSGSMQGFLGIELPYFSWGSAPESMGPSLEAPLGSSRTATKLVAGDGFMCALLDNATVKCWGKNSQGYLGYGDTSHRGYAAGTMGDSLPAINLGTGRTARDISATFNFVCVHLDNDTAKCWGRAGLGMGFDSGLGYGDTITRGDNSGEMGDSLPALDLGTGRTLKRLAVGGNSQHMCAVLDNDSLKCWGRNASGQLGYGDMVHRGDGAGEMGDSLPAVSLGTGRTAKAVAVGYDHTCAILDNDSVKCWGTGLFGALGYGDSTSRGDGAGEMGDSLPAVSLGSGRTAVALSLNTWRSCALLDNDTVKCWGWNYDGYLGLEDTNDRGDGAGEMGDSLPAVNLGGGLTVLEVRARADGACARLSDDSLKCWGNPSSSGLFGGEGQTEAAGSSSGTMGDSLAPIYVDGALSKSSEAEHQCAILPKSGKLKCWGRNTFGQLGYGDTNNRGDNSGEMGASLPEVNLGSGRRAVQVVTGAAFSCALLDNRSVKCWGFNAQGQLGYGDTTQRGDDAGEMGDSLPAVNLGSGRTAIQIAAGGAHVCALLDDTNVKCWGWGSFGALGYGDTTNRGDNSGEMGGSLPNLSLSLGTGSSGPYLIMSNRYSNCATSSSGTKCWGYNNSGQLSYGDTNHRGDGAGEMGASLPTLGGSYSASTLGYETACSTSSCFGRGGYIGAEDSVTRGDNSGESPVSVNVNGLQRHTNAISWHVCSVLTNGQVKCFGSGSSGQLGYGDTATRGQTSNTMGSFLPAVDLGTGMLGHRFGGGAFHTCALLRNAKVKCWGANAYGQLGYGDTIQRGDSAGEMGDSLPFVDLGDS